MSQLSIQNTLKQVKDNSIADLGVDLGFEEEKIEKILQQWHCIHFVKWNITTDTIKFWAQVLKYKDAAGFNIYKDILHWAITVLPLPHSKAEFEIIFILILTCILGYCIIKIFSRHNYFCLLLLLLPFAMYFKFFGFRIEPLMRITNEMGTSYLNGIPMHCCWTNPSAVREEVEILRSDFNFRLKQGFFISVTNAYYAGFLPCFFAQNFIYYDIVWVTEHTILIWYTTFVMYVIFCYPPKYFDVLQGAALHLGEWIEIDDCPSNQTPQKWSKSISWPADSVVRCNGKLYVSSGLVTSSIPGSWRELSFVGVYNDPNGLVLGSFICGIHIAFTILQTVLLCFTVEWHTILSLSFLVLANCHSLFYISIYINIAQEVHRMVTQKSIDMQFSGFPDVFVKAFKQLFF